MKRVTARPHHSSWSPAAPSACGGGGGVAAHPRDASAADFCNTYEDVLRRPGELGADARTPDEDAIGGAQGLGQEDAGGRHPDGHLRRRPRAASSSPSRRSTDLDDDDPGGASTDLGARTSPSASKEQAEAFDRLRHRQLRRPGRTRPRYRPDARRTPETDLLQNVRAGGLRSPALRLARAPRRSDRVRLRPVVTIARRRPPTRPPPSRLTTSWPCCAR